MRRRKGGTVGGGGRRKGDNEMVLTALRQRGSGPANKRSERLACERERNGAGNTDSKKNRNTQGLQCCSEQSRGAKGKKVKGREIEIVNRYQSSWTGMKFVACSVRQAKSHALSTSSDPGRGVKSFINRKLGKRKERNQKLKGAERKALWRGLRPRFFF